MFSANDIYSKGIANDKCKLIRSYAIQSLENVDTNTIEMILLQLVQTYRYEDYSDGLLKVFFLER